MGVYLTQIITLCLDTSVNLSACSVFDADEHNFDDFLRIALQIVVPGILRTLHKPLVADLRVFQLCVLFDIGQPQPVELILFHEGLCHVSGVILAYQLYTVCQTRLGVHSDGIEFFVILWGYDSNRNLHTATSLYSNLNGSTRAIQSGVPFIGKNIVGRIEAPSILDVVSLSVERDVLSSAIIYDRP